MATAASGMMGEGFRAGLSELLVVFFILALSAGDNVLQRQFKGHSLDPIGQGLIIAFLWFGTGVTFNHFAWYPSANIWLTAWLTQKWRESTLWTNWIYFVTLVAGFGGAFLAAWGFWGLHGGNLDAASGLAALDSFWTIFYYEFFGQLLINHVYVLSTTTDSNSWKYLSVSVVQGVLFAAFGNVTGGTFNLFWPVAYQAVLGTWNGTVIGASFAATVASAVATWFVVMAFFRETPRPVQE